MMAQDIPIPSELERELTHLLNRHSLENASNTPDFILAQFLIDVLHAWNQAVRRREAWYGHTSTIITGAATEGTAVPPPAL